MEGKKRLAWFILLRVVVVSIFLVSAVILNAKEPGSLGDETLSGLARLIIATYLFSILSLAALRHSEKFQQAFTYAQIIWDLLLVTLLILLTGGISSPYSFLYILSIINASVLLARREAIYTASLCAILYGAILDFQFYGKLGYFGLGPLPDRQFGASYVFYTIFINILAFYLTAFLTGYLAERAERSEHALHEKEIDYEELERLNSSIVFNIDSGLVTMNNGGEIRVFNRYLAELTGTTQEDAYGRSLAEIIPGLPPAGEDDSFMHRGEIEYPSPSGSKIILDFKTVPLFDREGNRAGVIVSLQDITRLKRMEAELKRADRLAAIGELSARIAHEIRNPLASISGSVQLIAQGEKVDVNDKKLLSIVLRETDRLNELIRDFLAYARPTRPLKIPILLKNFLRDLVALLSTDPRFEKVEICNDYRDEVLIEADRDQFQQVFWNLLVNAAEAMPAGGKIRVDAEVLSEQDIGIHLGDLVKISVTDYGSGMAGKDVKRVFEPFFTTKPGGTGLGLATVYRIVESHAGIIQVDSAIGAGTTFTIYLPVSQT
ncbi:MAG: ATP-binding protein [Geobacteraceae bacterium]|nr:ATP-binding protein [Geobacteraceae bacterium]